MRPAFGNSRPCGNRAALVGRLALPAAVAMLAVAAPAGADTGSTIIDRCTHGQSISGFTEQDYQRALQELPTEVEEYSDCGSLIRNAQLAAAGGGKATAGGGAPVAATPLTPAERTVLSRVPKVGAEPLVVGNAVIHPGVVHFDASSALSSLPNPLLAILALLFALALVLAGGALRNRVRARRSR